MNTNNQNRREFLQLGAAGLTALTFMKNTNAQTSSNVPIEEITVSELQNKMKSGELTSARKLTEIVFAANQGN